MGGFAKDERGILRAYISFVPGFILTLDTIS
jgi:hypothetical protein